jgi:hypothetical protein
VNVFSSPSLSFLLSGVLTPSERSERYRLLMGFYTILTSLYAVWMVLTLDILTPLIFGPSFTISPQAHILFVLIASLRLQRSGAPTTLLLASGRTKQLAFLNLSSGLGLLMAFACIVMWPSLESMLVGIAIGEFISFTIFFVSLERAVTRGSTVLIDLVAAFATPAVMAAALAWNPAVTWQSRGILFLIGVIAVCAQLSFEFFRNIKFRNLLFEVGEQFQVGGPSRG